MKVLYIHQYFKRPEEGGAIRSYYLARGLVEKNIEVEMVTAHNHPKYLNENVEGINVHYLPVDYKNEYGFFRRILSFLKFYILAYRLAIKLKNIDLIYATSTPLTVGMLGLKLKRKLKTSFFFEVRDLWPEAPIQMGVIKNRFIKRWLYQQEKKIYLGADKIIALSPGIRNSIREIVPHKVIYILPNMSDCKFFRFQPRKQKSINNKEAGKFVIGYFGSIGKVNRLEFFIELATHLNKISNQFSFIIVGRGSSLGKIKAMGKSLPNLTFYPFQNKEGLRNIISMMDAAYISFDNKKVLETNSPNKFFDALAAGKLIITNTKGWIRELCENHQCGIYADPLNPISIDAVLMTIIKDKNLLLKYQTNARRLAEVYYSRSLQINKLISIINNEHHMKINDDLVYILTA